ncbi:MAG: serine hydrolase [Candidatus Falkowbacteria bacterium]
MYLQVFFLILSSFFWHNFTAPIFSVSSSRNVFLEKQESRHLPARLASSTDLVVEAKSYAVLDTTNNIFLAEKSSNDQVQIASITKLMTALVFLDNNPGWETAHEMTRADRLDGGKIYLYLGDKVTLNDLFYAMLVGSDNTAAMALANSTASSSDIFVERMNDYAKKFGLLNTHFSDPAGLSSNNVSTAREVAQLLKIALDRDEIRRAVASNYFEFQTAAGDKKKITTTDNLLNSFAMPQVKIIGGKTGHTDLAGYCFAAAFTDDNNHNIISVVLGTASDKERFAQTNRLINWIYSNFTW